MYMHAHHTQTCAQTDRQTDIVYTQTHTQAIMTQLPVATNTQKLVIALWLAI